MAIATTRSSATRRNRPGAFSPCRRLSSEGRRVMGLPDFTLPDLTLAEGRGGLPGKAVSARELTQAYVAAVEAARPLNAFITETPERAFAMAEMADERLARGEGRALDGIPVAVKDLFCTRGVLTTAASHI